MHQELAGLKTKKKRPGLRLSSQMIPPMVDKEVDIGASQDS
jgi:hypothetical protein